MKYYESTVEYVILNIENIDADQSNADSLSDKYLVVLNSIWRVLMYVVSHKGRSRRCNLAPWNKGQCHHGAYCSKLSQGVVNAFNNVG